SCGSGLNGGRSWLECGIEQAPAFEQAGEGFTALAKAGFCPYCFAVKGMASLPMVPLLSDPWFYAAALPAVFLIGLSKGGLGGAMALIGVPLMSLVVPPVQAAAILLPIRRRQCRQAGSLSRAGAVRRYKPDGVGGADARRTAGDACRRVDSAAHETRDVLSVHVHDGAGDRAEAGRGRGHRNVDLMTQAMACA